MAFSVPPEETGCLTVDDCAIAFAAWGRAERDSFVLVHGAGAQMGWWDRVIPGLAADNRVIALDLSGNGDSGWRTEYHGEVWAAEVAAVAAHAGGGETVVLVGHSLGGRVSMIAAADHAEQFAGVVLLDAPLRDPDAPVRTVRLPAAVEHATLDAAIRSFHLRPHEPVMDRELLTRVAANSFRQRAGGWELKADPRIYGRLRDDHLLRCLGATAVPVTLVYGDRSAIVDQESRDLLEAHHVGATHFVSVPGGFHHFLFDHAAETVSAIRAAPTD